MAFSTPKKRKVADVLAEAAQSDASEPEFEAIDWREDELVMGPTPQLHGRIIGLFDTLTPAKSMHIVSTAPVATTPSTQRTVAKSPLKTPAFFKQVSMEMSDSKPRLLFPALPKRGLSVLIEELREMEDNEEDEGLQVLREMEAEFPPMHDADESGLAATAETTAGRDGKENHNELEGSGKVKWKKKGLKRSHRRVIMRPTAPKKRTTSSSFTQTAIHADENGNENDKDDESDEYYNSADEAADAEAALNPPPRVSGTINPSASTNIGHGARKQQKTGTTIEKAQKATTKKSKAGGISHNYKSLKLRNSGAKGGSRFGRGKFGGRR